MLAGSRFGGGSEQSSLDLAAQHPWCFFIPLEAEASSVLGNKKIPIQIAWIGMILLRRVRDSNSRYLAAR